MNRALLDKVIELKKSIEIKVLYVEDNEEVRTETLNLLKQLFNTVEVAANGKEGLEKFKSEKFDIIITDINMPVMNGLEMIKEIKNIDKRVPIIVITAFNDFEYLVESIKIGVYGYILKPIDIDQLLEAVYRVMEKVKLRQERDNALVLLEQYKKIIDESATVTKTDLQGVITYANEAFCKTSGYSKEELIGKPHNIVRHPDMPKEAFKNLWDTIQSKKIWQGVVKNRTKDGNAVYMKATVAPILNGKGEIEEYIAVRHNITDVMNPKKLLQDKISELKKPLLLMCKIEDYEDLENLYDVKTIEKIEQKFMDKAVGLFPKGCVFDNHYNLGNGEFAFVREYNKEKNFNDFLSDIKKFQDNIRKTVIEFDGYEYDIEIVISFATEKDHIIENAKMGLKKAVKEKLDIVMADGMVQKIQETAKKNIETLKVIKDAIVDKRVISHFQPIYNNTTNRVEKFESLVRIIDKDGNILPPATFLNVAKIGKYYKQITKIVTKNTIEAIKKVKKEIALNLSAVDIEDKDIREFIINEIKENSPVGNYLVVELLEDEGIHNQNIVQAFIRELKSLGVKIAIDDFGSGYSNFVRLMEYEPDYLKIDASLIKNIAGDKNSLNIVETIKNFADKQGYKTVAEFVANETIFEIVKALGIDYSQGYFIGKPDVLPDEL